ncbi:MAG: GH3 auxin-responsive promoter family protein [Bacteroidota bacterium]
MLSVINSLFKSYIGRYRSELELYFQRPIELQEHTLRTILKANQRTVFGQQYGFSSILQHRDVDVFSQRVPIHTYEQLLPYIERVLKGEQQVLTKEQPEWVATTSGTTGATKYIPLPSVAIRDSYRKGSWLSLACLYNRKPDITVFSSKNLLVGGSIKGLYPGIEVPYGDISAIMIRTIPRFMQPFYIPDVELATSTNYEEKIEKIAQLAAKEKSMTVLGGVPTWNLPLFNRILEIHGGDTMLDVWPDAQAFKHGGVKFDPYRSQFEALFPRKDFVFQEIYNATEGFFAVQDRGDLSSMLLLLTNGIYYEFVRWEDYQNASINGPWSEERDFKVASLAEVSKDEVYVMLITTNAGLYRYPMGDLIQFTDLFPFRIKILGRTQEFINAFGEDLLRAEAEDALQSACEKHGVTVMDFTVAPKYTELGVSGRHEWFVEFSQPPQQLDVFIEDLDLALQGRNYNYGAKRLNDFGMQRLELHPVPTGFFKDWLKSRGKLGGQHKVPRLANHRKIAEEILVSLA